MTDLAPLLDTFADAIAERITARLEAADDEVLDTAGMAKILKLKSASAARARCAAHEIPARYIGGQYRITRRALLRYLDGAK